MKSRDEIYPFLQEFISQRSDIKDIAFSDGATLYELDLFNWINNNYSGRPAVGGAIILLINHSREERMAIMLFLVISLVKG